MELVKNIFFNTDKLIEGTNVKISYTGRYLRKTQSLFFFIMVLVHNGTM